MRAFLLTSDRFKGSFEVWYGFDGMLVKIDLMNSSLNYEQVQFILKNISPDVDQFRGMLTGSNLTAKDITIDPTVDEFLHNYPYQRNTHLVRQTFPKMDRKERVMATYKAIDYAEYVKREQAKWDYKPQLPDTWLRKKQYLNDWKNA